MKQFRYIITVVFLGVLLGCSKDGDGGDSEPVITPGAVSLVFPDNNTECNEGTIISDTQSEVTFQWNAATNADTYLVEITNLETNTSQLVTSATTSAPVTILRSTTFSWSVVARNTGSGTTSESPVWRFHNAGLPEETHVPFQAEVVSPELDSRVFEGSVSLQWSASDLDNDIVSYDILLDTANPPTALAGTATSKSFQATVVKDLTYYWQVITIDATGNRSTSDVFNFHVDEAPPVIVGDNLLLDGEMNDTNGWTYKQLWTAEENAVNHAFVDGEFAFRSVDDSAVRTNALLWQEVDIEVGKTYQFTMDARSGGNTNTWLEVFFGNQTVEAAGDDYTDGGAEIFVKSFGDNENCGLDPYDGDIYSIAADGCPLPEDSLLNSNGTVTFSASDLTADGTLIVVIKSGNYDGNFGDGIFIDDVILREVN